MTSHIVTISGFFYLQCFLKSFGLYLCKGINLAEKNSFYYEQDMEENVD